MGKALRYISIMLLCVAYSHAMEMVVKTDGAFEVLPIELRSKIAKNVFNLVAHEGVESKEAIYQERLENCRLQAPILLNIERFHDVHRMQPVCRYKIGGKQFLPWDLLLLPSEQQNVFIRVANRSGLSIGDIDADDYKIIEKVHDDLKKGLKFNVNLMNKKVANVQLFGGCSLLLAGLSCVFSGIGIKQDISVVIGAMGTVTGLVSIGLAEVMNWFNADFSKENEYWYLKAVEL